MAEDTMCGNGAMVVQEPDGQRLADLGINVSARMVAMMSCSPDCIKLLNPDGRLTYMSSNGLCAMEIDDFNAVRSAFWWELWPQASQSVPRRAVEIAASGRMARFIAPCPTAKGVRKMWEVTLSGVTDERGTVREILCVSRHAPQAAEAELTAL